MCSKHLVISCLISCTKIEASLISALRDLTNTKRQREREGLLYVILSRTNQTLHRHHVKVAFQDQIILGNYWLNKIERHTIQFFRSIKYVHIHYEYLRSHSWQSFFKFTWLWGFYKTNFGTDRFIMIINHYMSQPSRNRCMMFGHCMWLCKRGFGTLSSPQKYTLFWLIFFSTPFVQNRKFSPLLKV